MKFSEVADAYAVLASLSESQRKILVRVIQEAYDLGIKEAKGPLCAGCKSLGPDLNLSESTIPSMGGTGLYCARCRLKAANNGENYKGPVPVCDGCNTVDEVQALDIEHSDLKALGGPGMYCRFCRTSMADDIREYDEMLDKA